MTLMVMASSDAHVRRAAPSANSGAAARLLLRGAGSSLDEYAFIHFTLPFPPAGATILTAKLHLFRCAAWSGTKTVNVRRITGPQWAESSLTWNNRPAVDTTVVATLSAGAGADNTELVIDVLGIIQQVAAGASYFGLRVDLTENTEVAVRSSEAGDVTVRPVLEIAYTTVPDPPDHLNPDGNDATSEQKPTLAWQAADQTSYQLQVATDAAFTSLSLDTGKTAGSQRSLDTSTTTLPAVATGSSRYWRVQVWNTSDVPSGWSQPAQWQRQPLSTLTISNPGATAPETTPPIVWAFGGTQVRWQVTLYRIETSGPMTQLWQTGASDSSVAATPPADLIVTGPTYRALVEVWDSVGRYNDQHARATQDFTYVRSGVPAAPTGLVAAPYVAGVTGVSPAVVLTWQRSSAPDYWALRVNGVEVAQRIPMTDCLVSGTSYQLIWWGLTPRVPATLEIEAVVQSGGAGTPFQHSGGNPTVTYTPTPIGIWLVDDSSPGKAAGECVQLLGVDAADWSIGEAATTYDPIGVKVPVRITDTVRGYEGNVTGTLHTPADRDLLLDLKARELELRLIAGDVCIPIMLEAVFARPTPQPNDQLYDCGFAFFQTGDPWPVA